MDRITVVAEGTETSENHVTATTVPEEIAVTAAIVVTAVAASTTATTATTAATAVTVATFPSQRTT